MFDLSCISTYLLGGFFIRYIRKDVQSVFFSSSCRKKYIILRFEDLADRERWYEAFVNDTNRNSVKDEPMEPKWLKTIKPYNATKTDEISLFVGEAIQRRKTRDAWMKGVKVKDGSTGWFPKDCVETIDDPKSVERFDLQFKRLTDLY